MNKESIIIYLILLIALIALGSSAYCAISTASKTSQERVAKVRVTL